MREGEEHVLVEEVEDHLADAHVVPPPVHQHQPPQHPELRESIIAGLHRRHALLPEQPDPDVRCLYHRDIVGTVSDGQCYLVEVIPHQLNYFCLLDRQQSAAHHCPALLRNLHQHPLALFVVEDVPQILPLHQQRVHLVVRLARLGQEGLQLAEDHLLNLPVFGVGEEAAVVGVGQIALEPESEGVEVGLDQPAALRDVFSGVHLVSGEHPHLDVWVGQEVLARRRSRMVSGTSSCSLSRTAVAPTR